MTDGQPEEEFLAVEAHFQPCYHPVEYTTCQGGYVIPFKKLFGTLAKGMSRTIVGRGVNNSHCTQGQTIFRLKGGKISESPDRTHKQVPNPQSYRIEALLLVQELGNIFN